MAAPPAIRVISVPFCFIVVSMTRKWDQQRLKQSIKTVYYDRFFLSSGRPSTAISLNFLLTTSRMMSASR